ncbi:unnamed protein product [Rotaria magnacalcarata]|uniref:EGF-like domain-containing protein n=1 Tax=Rotaria magnacalcarata TaxID=392030 RepID=A0A816TH89_9BILA|nr:unnamed protein product [Rotaria magnacalcarata]CAF3844116.1 unnamed protein product [Rotaria magnacalcarata]
MHRVIFFLILLVACGTGSALINHRLLDRVNAYIDNHRLSPNARSSSEGIYLQNSNKIGLGYNPLYGSPVCYTGECQMQGFAQPIFQLNYHQIPKGSCTTRLIPEYTFLDCLPSTELQADTEIIDTVEQLKETTSKSIDVSAKGGFWKFSFSYKYSEQARYMLDHIIKRNLEVLYTSARISYVKLSMFEPFMNLTETFRYVIEQLPCCDYDETVELYIQRFIFDYFGFTYVNSLLLGGIARQNIFIEKSDISFLETQGYTRSHEAQAEFYISLNGATKIVYDKEKHNKFMRYVKKTYATTLGGDTSVQTIDEWSKTVPSNPVVTKFGISYIFDLLNKRRFPHDDQIFKKSKLIEKALNKYIDNQLYCYNNCSGNGVCQETGYFQFGECKCKDTWKGFDCSQQVSTTTTTTTTTSTPRAINSCQCVRRICSDCLQWSCSGRRRRREVIGIRPKC